MRIYFKQIIAAVAALLVANVAGAQTLKADGTYDPDCVVEKWSNSSAYKKVIDINFNDDTWPDTWQGKYAVDCPEYVDSKAKKYGGYINAVLETPANGGSEVKYPVVFHNCTFATKKSYNGLAGTTAAMGRVYDEQAPAGTNQGFPNNWTMEGHKVMLEDNVTYGSDNRPTHGEAGFVQMCRDKNTAGANLAAKKEWHGWVEIDHIPYVERIQWSWSGTSAGRGIKCDYKIGNGPWLPLVWMASEQIERKYTAFSDQGYFIENIINAEDVSIRWRVWDGERTRNQVQSDLFPRETMEHTWYQAPRLHKIQIFGNEITAEQAQYARDNRISDPGELTDLSIFGVDSGDDYVDTAPDANAPVTIFTVAQDGSGDFTTIQAAIDAVGEGRRGIIYVRPGVYDENIYSGTKTSKNKFISLIGEDKETTILTSSVSRGSGNATFNDCAALNVFTERFYAENITIRNTSGNHGQAEALYTHGDAHIFKNCILSGYQDTYKANGGARGYFTDCTIIGATDFIYDSGLEWFENCEIRCLKGGNGYVTAAGDAFASITSRLCPSLSVSPLYLGLFFNNCNITAEDGTAAASYVLGRPWKEKAGTVFMNCTLGNHIKPAGWTDWNNVGANGQCTYIEYKNKNADGSLADVSKRVAWSHQATDAEVADCIFPKYIFEQLKGDIPFDYERILKGAAAPTGFTLEDGSITWQGDKMTVGYILYKDGQFAGILTEPTITIEDGDNANYTVKAISRHGVTSVAKKVADPSKMLAFPTAEGFGKYTSGGRGGKVVKVTSLADDNDGATEGTLRWAFKQHPDEPITIVFAVSGEIKLVSDMRVKRNDWTLAGQTAPGEGIVITHNKMNFGGSQNFIIRNVRFRIGQNDASGSVVEEGAVATENCANYIFDHCTVGWSVEENMNTQDSHFLTVQNTMVHEGLYDAGHKKGARGYGSQWGGSPATYHHNLLAHNNSRSPRINGARGEDYVVFMEYVNNVNYNYGSKGGCYGGENTAEVTKPITDPDNPDEIVNSRHECNFMNNYYKAGPLSNQSSVAFVNSSYARSGATSHGPAKWFVNGNVATASAAATADNWKGMEAEHYSLVQIRVDERITPKYPYYRYTAVGGEGRYIPANYMLENIETAEEAYNTIVVKKNVGCVNKDKVELRILDEVLNGTAKYGTRGRIDNERQCEGFLAYPTDYVVPVDTDGDGMPDEWEKANGLNPNVADQNSVNDDGYTALEVYLNSLMGETMDNHFTTGIAGVTMESTTVSYDRATRTVHVGENAVGGTVAVFSLDGRLLSSMRITAPSVHLSSVGGQAANGVILIRVDAKGICPRILKTAM